MPLNRPRRSLVFAAALAPLAFACNEDGKGAAESVRDAAAPIHDRDASIAAPLPPFATLSGRTLVSLDAQEIASLCAEKQRRVDPCRAIAVSTTKTEDDCNRVIADCRGAAEESGVPFACGTSSFKGGCSVTVEEYVSCLDAWSAALTCDVAGFSIPAPDACHSVVANCARLEKDFELAGKPRTCTDVERTYVPNTSDDIYGLDACPPVPARLVVLGDSIAECTGVTHAQCAPSLLAAHLRDTVASDLELESYALAGARVHDLLTQMTLVPPGPDHLFVFIYAVGNDILTSDFDVPGLEADFDAVFAYFTDATRFPGGATFLLNTQYTPLDECYTAGARTLLEAGVVPLMKELNQKLFIDAAEARKDAVAVDQYPDFLGHGLNGNLSGCPYCSKDNTPWTDDGVHPNALGHAEIAGHWIRAVDEMFGTCTDAGAR